MNLDEETASRELLRYPKPCFVNLGSGVETTIEELAHIVRDIVGYRGNIVFDTDKPDGTPRKLLDVSKITSLGWKPSIDLADGIKKTYQWYSSCYGE
jgi:GDP-L-fucose synthase